MEREREKRVKNKPKTCPVCLKQFERKHHGFHIQKFCSNKCFTNSQEKKKNCSVVSRKAWKKLKKNKRKYAEHFIKRSINSATRLKKMSWKSLKFKLDSYFSRIVRLQERDEFERISCFTCGKKDALALMDCGHYVSRRSLALRWDFRNAHPQCRYCNRYAHGAMDTYALKLQEKYGNDILSILNKEKEKIVKPNIEYFDQKILELYSKAEEKSLQKTVFSLSDSLYIANLLYEKNKSEPTDPAIPSPI